MTGNSLVCQFDTYEFLRHAIGFLLNEGFFANELRLVQLTEHRKTCHDGRDVSTKLVAIEGQTYFEAQRVATAEATGLAASAFDEFVPCFLREFV